MWLSVLIFGLSLFSGVWLWLGLSYIGTEIGFYNLESVNPSDLGVMVTSISVPILVAIMVMVLVYNQLFIKNLFTNQQAFIKLLQKKLDMSERIDAEKIDIDLFHIGVDNLITQSNHIIASTGAFTNHDIKNMWEMYSYGDKYAFLDMAVDGEKSASINARIEAKIIQDEVFFDEITEICNIYDDIYAMAQKYDRGQILIKNLLRTSLTRFVLSLAAYKRAENTPIEQDLKNAIEIEIETPMTEDDDLIYVDEKDESGEKIDWSLERNELIDKYRNFASSIKSNIDKGVLDEK